MSRRLTPVAIAERLFAIPPDRDERASQLCGEALLTLAENGYSAPPSSAELASPKRERWAVRSLALSQNFLEDRNEGRAGAEDLTPQRYGELLAAGEELRASANLRLAKRAYEGLIDPSTQAGQPGSWLLLPFHESLLWYDARKQRGRPWGVRKVYMRGSGITLARLLADPPLDELRVLGASSVEATKAALQEDSPLARIAEHIETPLADLYRGEDKRVEDDERRAWEAGKDPRLEELAVKLCRHCEGVMRQGSASGPAKLWQLRTILALDLATHALTAAWDTLEIPEQRRHLLLTFGGPPRAENRIRQRSEDAYQQARIVVREATVRTIATVMQELHQGREPVTWNDEFEPRALRRIGQVPEALSAMSRSGRRSRLRRGQAAEFERWAREAAEGADYDRTGQGFRVLLESIGMLAGTGAYRYLTATPDLLAAMVGAFSARVPMSSDEFFGAVFTEWQVLVGPGQLAESSLAEHVDGSDLARNQARAEAVLAEAGLALALSDRTTIVGERARRGR